MPLSISRAHLLPVPQGFRLPQVDLVALAAEDAVNDLDKSIPYRFGFNHTVDLDLNNSGTWTTLEEGTRVWRLGLECPSAISVNFEFHDFEYPVGAKVFVLNETGDHLVHSHTPMIKVTTYWEFSLSVALVSPSNTRSR